MRNAGLHEAQTRLKIQRRNINNPKCTDDRTLMAESGEELKTLDESENVGLNLNIQKTKIMASGPITSWQIEGEIMERVTYFFFFFLGERGSKITADGDCSHEIKRCLLLERKTMS